MTIIPLKIKSKYSSSLSQKRDFRVYTGSFGSGLGFFPDSGYPGFHLRAEHVAMFRKGTEELSGLNFL